MRRYILLLAFLVLAVPFPGANAQEKKRDWEDRFKAEKIAYLTDAMDLTSAEAERFWPVYNKCECERKSCFRASMKAYKALNEAIASGKDGNEINSLLDKYIEAQESGKNIDRRYVAEFRKILPSQKVAKLYIAEESFRRQQIHRLHKNDNKKNKDEQ